MATVNASNQNGFPTWTSEASVGNQQQIPFYQTNNIPKVKCENSENQELLTGNKCLQNTDTTAGMLEQILLCKSEQMSTSPLSPQQNVNEEVKEDASSSLHKPVLHQMTAVVHPLPSKPIQSVCGKNRTRFSPTMVQFMEKHYQENKYPKADDYKYMASVLGLDWNKIKIWFQNRRSKERKENGRVAVSHDNEPERKRRKLDSDHNPFHIEQKSMDSFAEAKPLTQQKQDTVLPNLGQGNNIFAKVQDDVNHLTNQLCTSQINPAKLSFGSESGMWQPFTGLGGNGNQVMKDVKAASVPSGSVLIPPVIQPMLLGMPPVYMIPPVTPIDLTKKTPDMSAYYHPRPFIPGYRMESQYRTQYNNPHNKTALLENEYSLQQNSCNLAQQIPLQQPNIDMAYNNDFVRYTQTGVNKSTDIQSQPKGKPLEYKHFQGPTPLQKLLTYDNSSQGIPKMQLKSVASDYDTRKFDLRPSSLLPQQLPISSSGYPKSYLPTQYERRQTLNQNTSFTMAYPLYSNSGSKMAHSFHMSVPNTAAASVTLPGIKNKDSTLSKIDLGRNMDILKTTSTSTYGSGVRTCSDTSPDLMANFDGQYKGNGSLNPDQIYLQVTPNSTSDIQVEIASESIELHMESKSLSLTQHSGSVIPVKSPVGEFKAQNECFSSLKYSEKSSTEQRDSGIGASVNLYSDYFSLPRAGTSQISETMNKGKDKNFSPNSYYDINNIMSQLSPVLTQNPLSPSSSPPLCTSTPVKGIDSAINDDDQINRHVDSPSQNILQSVQSPYCFDQHSSTSAAEFNVMTSQPYEFPVESSLGRSRQSDLNNNSSGIKDFEKDYVQL